MVRKVVGEAMVSWMSWPDRDWTGGRARELSFELSLMPLSPTMSNILNPPDRMSSTLSPLLALKSSSSPSHNLALACTCP